MQIDAQLAQFVRRMPKVELHLHLEGTLRPATLLELAKRHGIRLPADDAAGLERWFRFRDFPNFVQVWLAVVGCLRDAADFARVTRELGESAAAQNALYLEVAFAPATHRHHKGTAFDEMWGGIREGASWAERELGVRMQFIVDLPRNRRPGTTGSIEACAEWAIARRPDGVVALGLGGTEAGNPPELFEAVFRHASANGLRSWPHAGETVGPESVWGAVRALGAERIAHGVRAVEDPALLAHLAAHRIACDVCPGSNVCLGVYPSIAQHPIRGLIEAGVPVTLGTDNPPLFHTTLADEFLALVREQAFSAAEVAALVRNGVEASFLAEREKAELRERVDAGLAGAAREAGISL